MTTIYLAVGCGPDYDVQLEAYATREEAQAGLCDWMDDYSSGDAEDEEITSAKRAIMAGETAYTHGGEHWFEVRAIGIGKAPADANALRFALAWALDQIEDDLDPDRQAALCSARALIHG